MASKVDFTLFFLPSSSTIEVQTSTLPADLYAEYDDAMHDELPPPKPVSSLYMKLFNS
jgi:hypothetical protein